LPHADWLAENLSESSWPFFPFSFPFDFPAQLCCSWLNPQSADQQSKKIKKKKKKTGKWRFPALSFFVASHLINHPTPERVLLEGARSSRPFNSLSLNGLLTF